MPILCTLAFPSGQSGDAAIRQSFRKYKEGRNVPLPNMVVNEFKHVVNGVHLAANRVAKKIDANRFHGVVYKIIRGLHFHHTAEYWPLIGPCPTPLPRPMSSKPQAFAWRFV